MGNYIDAIRKLERESRALHDEVHRTFKLRGETPHKFKDWQRAAERFRTFKSDLDQLIEKCWPSSGDLVEPHLREFMFDYIEVDPRFFRSGYILEKVLARIKKLKLTPDETVKVQTLLLSRVRTGALRNFRHICRLIPMIEDRRLRETVAELALSDDPAIRRRAEFAWYISRSRWLGASMHSWPPHLRLGAGPAWPHLLSNAIRRHIMSIRPVIETRRASPHIEGAGVHLHRAFGFQDPTEADPFLLFDDFRGDHPRDYSAGFPWHPHRGIETITYVLAGTVEHGDSLGNRGILGPGSLQLMTAGRGILHQEMPKGDAKGRMHGFQLWGNLPRALKMTAPRYQDMEASALPERHEDDGTSIRVVIGDYRGVKSPVDGIAADPQYLDVFVPAGKRKTFKVDTRRRAFAYVFEGSASFRDAARPEGVLLEKEVKGQEVNIRDLSGNRTLVRFGAGDEVTVTAGPDGVRFLLISGAPIEEPVAWAGPIVMNSEAELQQAFKELRNGTFIRPAH